MYLYTLLLFIIFNHFSLSSTNDNKTLTFSVDAYLDCPWNTQKLHDEQQCGNCKNAKNAMIKEFYTLGNKTAMITRKSNFEITSLIVTILKETIEIGLQQSETIEKKKKLISDITDCVSNNKSQWLSLYKDFVSQDSAKIQLLECAYKQFCSIHLYKTQKTPTPLLKEPKTFNIKLPVSSYYDPYSYQNIITAPNGVALFYSFYTIEAIPNLFNIFVLTTVPSQGHKMPFNANIKQYYWNHLTDFLDQKSANLDK